MSISEIRIPVGYTLAARHADYRDGRAAAPSWRALQSLGLAGIGARDGGRSARLHPNGFRRRSFCVLTDARRKNEKHGAGRCKNHGSCSPMIECAGAIASRFMKSTPG